MREAASRLLDGVEGAEQLPGGSHLKVRLTPLPVVARVASFGANERFRAAFTREVAVGNHLRNAGVPAIYPTDLADPGPHPVDDSVMTLWEFVDIDRSRTVTAAELDEALDLIAGALATFPEPLPRLPSWDGVMEVRHGFEAAGMLDHEVVQTAARAADRVDERLRSLPESEWVPAHGDANPGNLLAVAGEWRWCDFEEVCTAPRLWDTATAYGWTVLYGWRPDVTSELVERRAGGEPERNEGWRTALGARMCYAALLGWWMSTRGFPTPEAALRIAESAVGQLDALGLT